MIAADENMHLNLCSRNLAEYYSAVITLLKFGGWRRIFLRRFMAQDKILADTAIGGGLGSAQPDSRLHCKTVDIGLWLVLCGVPVLVFAGTDDQ